MKVKITDVAKECGVSIATVSHVINGTRYVSPETTQKVQDAIRKLGYQPDIGARNFKKGRKGLIALLVPDISTSRSATIFKQLDEVLSAAGFHLIVANTNRDPEKEREQLKILCSGVVDGVVLFTACKRFSQLSPAIPRDFPLVFIDTPLNDIPYPSLLISSYTALYQGVEDLIRQGHTRIGYICDQVDLAYSAERLDAYRTAIRDFGLDLGEELVVYSDRKTHGAYVCAKELMEKGCTAIAVSNNQSATDAMKYLSGARLQLGRDVELLGFSGNDWYEYRTESIARVSQPVKEMARMAGQQLLEQIEAGVPAQPRTTVLHSSYIPKHKKEDA